MGARLMSNIYNKILPSRKIKLLCLFRSVYSERISVTDIIFDVLIKLDVQCSRKS